MKIVTLVSGLAISAVIGVAHAEIPAHAHDKAQQMEAHSAARKVYAGVGVLKGVKTGKVQITHEPIAELEWPAMTMWFVLQVPVPREVKIGDNVYFEMEQTPERAWALTRIERKR